MSVSIPYTFVGGAGNKARAAEVNANFQAIAAKFTEGAGGITDGDISTVAGIRAVKLSTVAGNRITQAQLEDDAVDLRVLKDDASAGSPNAAVNNASHIKDGIITGVKLVAATLALDRLKVSEYSHAPAIAYGAGSILTFDTGLAIGTNFPIAAYIASPSFLVLTGFYHNGATWRVAYASEGLSVGNITANTFKVKYISLT